MFRQTILKNLRRLRMKQVCGIEYSLEFPLGAVPLLPVCPETNWMLQNQVLVQDEYGDLVGFENMRFSDSPGSMAWHSRISRVLAEREIKISMTAVWDKRALYRDEIVPDALISTCGQMYFKHNNLKTGEMPPTISWDFEDSRSKSLFAESQSWLFCYKAFTQFFKAFQMSHRHKLL